MADVRDDEDRSRYEITVDGRIAGIAHYTVVEDDGVAGRVFDHTKIEPQFEGRGIGTELARGALDDIRARGIPMAATCPFIVSFVERHPEYQDLVVERLLAL